MADRLIPLKTDGTLPALVVEAVQDILGAALVAGTNVTSVVYNDAAGTVTINAATQAGGGGGGLDAEAVQDTVAAMIVAGTGITATYNDGAGTLTLTASGGGGGGAAETPIYDVRSWITNTTMAATGSDSLPNTFLAYRVGNMVTLNYDCIADVVTYSVFTAPTGWRPKCPVAGALAKPTPDYLDAAIVLAPSGAGSTNGGGRRRGTLHYICTETTTATGTVAT